MTQFKGFAGNDETQLRQWFAYLVKQDSVGIASDGTLTGLGVAQTATASASVVVGKGAGVVQDTGLAGAVPLVLDSDLTLDVLTANPVGGLPRNDLVVFDSATVTAGAGGVRVIVGTPNASPTDPTLPATAVPLARLRHAASATTVPTAKIDDLRVTTSLFQSPDSAPGLRVKYTECRTLLGSWSKAVGAAVVTNVQWEPPETNTLGLTRTDAATLTVPAGMGGMFVVTVAFGYTLSAAERRFVELFTTSSVMTYRSPFYADGFGSLTALVWLPAGGGMRVQVFSQTAATASSGQWTITRIGA